jgi:hypothetical protein
VTLDPPSATGAEAGPPLLDEDYLILSTIHSAKGQEWDAVFVLNVVDGCIPSDMATGTPEEIEEERRLLYVAMTRAKSTLHLIRPLRFFVRQQHRHGDRHVIAPLTRFIPETILDRFERVTEHDPTTGDGDGGAEQEACASTSAPNCARCGAAEVRLQTVFHHLLELRQEAHRRLDQARRRDGDGIGENIRWTSGRWISATTSSRSTKAMICVGASCAGWATALVRVAARTRL